MSNMERQNFEDSWKNAFDKAEVNPSDTVWTNVELELERAEGGKMKRRLLFFKMLAAASVVFALAAGSLTVYVVQQKNAEIAQVKTQTTSEQQAIVNPSRDNKIQSEDQTRDHSSISENRSQNNNTGEVKTGSKKYIAELHKEADMEGKSQAKETKGNVQQTQIQTHDNSLPQRSDDDINIAKIAGERDDPYFANENSSIMLSRTPMLLLTPSQKPSLILPKKEEVDPVVVMLARLDAQEKEVQHSDKKQSQKNEKLWTSLGFAAGSFNTVSSGISGSRANAVLASNSQIADKEAKASGTAYSVGVNMGTKLSARWVLQGGVNYLSQSSDYSAQSAVGTNNFQSFRPASIVELNKLNDSEGQNSNKLVATAPYNVNNNVQYLSVPLQAGYLIINRRFGLQLNAGLSTDLFLQNTKSADSPSFDKVTQGSGGDSPYRPVNFSGLAGTEVSYKFGSRYRLALNPGVRYPFKSIYKSDVGVQSTPITFDIGLRFRYIFH
jgi:hypothetical protein